MGFGSYDESEQREIEFDEDDDFSMDEKMKRARYIGEDEQTDTDISKMMEHL